MGNWTKKKPSFISEDHVGNNIHMLKCAMVPHSALTTVLGRY